VGWSNYEDGLEIGPAVRSWRFADGRVGEPFDIPATPSSTGPLAVADLDGNGSFILFVGGRVLPGRYPSAPSSRLFRWRDAGWKLDVAWTKNLEQVGLVNGATFSDLTGDGVPELLLACEWGPVRVFQLAEPLSEMTAACGLDQDLGWWSGVTTGDFDADGKLDIVAGNFGLNSPYRPSREAPVRLFYGDFDQNTTTDLFESYDEPTLAGQPVPRHDRTLLQDAMPFLRIRFPRHEDYARATVRDILGPLFEQASMLSSSQLASVIWFNRGDHFELKPLPPEAQFAPVFGINVADFDGNGTEDLFLAQNFFATSKTLPRLDAGRGLLLLGDGSGGFLPQRGQDSGILVYGEQRGSAVSDFDGDGRTDLVVTQNGNQTRLLRNLSGKPGVRVHLRGSPANPLAIGAVVRPWYGTRPGAARELRAGGGYLSQDSLVPVFAAGVTRLEIRWPGGTRTECTVPGGAADVSVTREGVSAQRP